MGGKPARRAVLALLCAALAAGIVFFLLYKQRPPAELPVLDGPSASAAAGEDASFSILFIDVGQADSMLVRCGDESMLVDGGNVGDSDLVATVLQKQGVGELDYAVCTHAHEDHAGGIPGALHTTKVNKLYCPVKEADSRYFQNLLKEAGVQNLEITVPKPDETFSLGGATVQILGPREDYSETNNTSIVLMITYGRTKFLLTGDMEAAAEKDLVEAGCDLDADLLKAGHHGSGGSSSYVFLKEVTPEYVIVSCGQDNDYGHPHEEAMSRFRDAEARVYRTDYQGDILAESDGNTITITTARNQDVETNAAPGSGEGFVPYYIGNSSSKKFHRPDCSGLPENDRRVRFESREEAVAAGYTACSRCKP